MSEQEKQSIHYIHRMSYTVQERIVGIFVLSALGMIFFLMFINSQTAHMFEDRITLNTYLSKAEGISTETVVKISGIEVGRVSSLDIARDHRIHVKLIIYKRYQPLVRSDSTAAVSKLSLLGKSIIDITAGSTEQPMLLDGATIAVEEPLSVEELMAELTPVIQAVESSVTRVAEIMERIAPQQVGNIVANLEESSQNFKQVSAQLSASEGSVGMAINDPTFKNDLTTTLAAIERSFVQMEQRLKELEPASGNISEGSKELPAISAELRQLLSNTNAILTSVNVEMKQVPELITRMNVLMEETDRLLDGINNSWIFSSDEKQLRRKLIGVQPYHE